MKSRLDLRRILVAVLAGVLIGGGLMAVTPAGAEVAQAAATNWKKIWKKKLQPLADKRYYTKQQSDSTFARKTDLGNYWTKAESDAKYQPKGNYALSGSSYTKAESDAKYAGAGTSYSKTESDGKYDIQSRLYRGAFVADVPSGTIVSTHISFGTTFSATPSTHVIAPGAVPPEGCSGTSAAPNAAPGHLCVFESAHSGNVGTVSVTGANAFSALIFGTGIVNAATPSYIQGTWAARPAAVTFPTVLGAKDAPESAAGTGR